MAFQIGEQFGKLTVIRQEPYQRVLCRCACGAEKYIRGSNLRTGNTRSCGCSQFDAIRKLRRQESDAYWDATEKLVGQRNGLWLCTEAVRARRPKLRVRCAVCGLSKWVMPGTFTGRMYECTACRSWQAIADPSISERMPRVTDADGYVRIVFGRADVRGTGSGGHILEHRMVMEQHAGRPLESAEIVHHINEDRADNRLKNLRLCNGNGEHLVLHGLVRNPNNQQFPAAFAREWQYEETCACGCGETFPAFRFDSNGKRAAIRKFRSGHNTRGLAYPVDP